MADDPKDPFATEMAGAANLLAHPVAGVAAMSALGFGVASHVFGFWMGALTGAAKISQQLFEQTANGDFGSAFPVASKAGVAETVKAEVKPSAKPAGGQKKQGAVKAGARARATVKAVAKLQAVPLEVAAAEMVRSKRAQTVDDLKAIAGVGPKLEQVLNNLGIRSYTQIAMWTDEDIAAMEETLGFKGRIIRDNWTGQAKALTGLE